MSIKFEIKIHLSVWGGFFLLFCCFFFSEWLFSRFLTSDEPGAKSINEKQLLSRVRHSDKPGNEETDRYRRTDRLRNLACCGFRDLQKQEKDFMTVPPIRTISSVINQIPPAEPKKHWGNSFLLWQITAIPENSPITFVIVSSSVPAASTHTHTKTTLFKNTRKGKGHWLSLTTYCKSSPSSIKWCSVRPPQQGGWSPSDRLGREENMYRTANVLWDLSRWSEINMRSLSLTIFHRGRDKKSLLTFSLCSDCVGSFSFPSDSLGVRAEFPVSYANCLQTSRRVRPLPGWMAVKLFAQGDECVCMCVYSAQLQCVTKALVMLHTCVCVWLCVSGCISTDLPAPATVRRVVFPIPQTPTVKGESREMFHLNSVIYRLFSFSSFSSFDPISKAKPVGKEWYFSHFFFFPPMAYILWISGIANDHVLWLKK